jgi:hypothetical protein
MKRRDRACLINQGWQARGYYKKQSLAALICRELALG